MSLNPQNDQMAVLAERELIDVIVSGRAGPEELADVFSQVGPDDFLSPQCALAFDVCMNAFSAYGSISKGSLIGALADTVSPQKSSVIDMLNEDPPHTLATGLDSTTLGRVIQEMSKRRRVESLLTTFTPDDTSASMSSKVMDGLSEIAMSGSAEAAIDAASQEEPFLRSLTGMAPDPILPIGFEKFDSMLGGGLRPGQFVIIAARPAKGKSTFGLNVACNVAYGMGGNVMFFSLEMGRDEIIRKVVASESSVKLSDILNKSVQQGSHDWDSINSTFEKMRESGGHVFINDTAKITSPAIAASVKAQMLKTEVDLVIIDYLQLMDGAGNGGQESRQQEVSAISRSMKLLAKQLQIPVIAMSQLNRGPIQKNGEKRQPMISDLRESGSLEQDADIIMLIGESKTKDDENEEKFSEDISVPIFLAKNRNGPTGEMRVAPMLAYSRFEPVGDGAKEVPDFLMSESAPEPVPDVDDVNVNASETTDPSGTDPWTVGVDEESELFQ